MFQMERVHFDDRWIGRVTILVNTGIPLARIRFLRLVYRINHAVRIVKEESNKQKYRICTLLQPVEIYWAPMTRKIYIRTFEQLYNPRASLNSPKKAVLQRRGLHCVYGCLRFMEYSISNSSSALPANWWVHTAPIMVALYLDRVPNFSYHLRDDGHHLCL